MTRECIKSLTKEIYKNNYNKKYKLKKYRGNSKLKFKENLSAMEDCLKRIAQRKK